MIRTEVKIISDYIKNEKDLFFVIGDKGGTTDNVINLTERCGGKFVRTLLDFMGLDTDINENRTCYLVKNKDLTSIKNIVLKRSIANEDTDFSVNSQYFSEITMKVIRKKRGKVSAKSLEKEIVTCKEVLSEMNVPLGKVAIVNGMVLEICGLREHGDVDLIMSSDERCRLGDTHEIIELSSNIEVKPADTFKLGDDAIIFNEEYFFIFRGMKCVSPPILYKKYVRILKKKTSWRDMALLWIWSYK